MRYFGYILVVVFTILAIDVHGQAELLNQYKQSESKKDISAQSQSAIELGVYYQENGNLDSAIYFFQKALEINEEGKILSATDEARVNYSLGNTFRAKGEYSDAVKNYELALSISVENNLKQREASVLNSLGGLYVEIEEYEKGLDYCKRGLEIYQTHYPEREADICLFLTNIGNISVEIGKYEEADAYLAKANELNQKIQNDYYAALIHSGLGLSNMKQQKFEQAINDLNKALDYSILAQATQAEAAVLANLGQTYLDLKQYDNAERVLLKSYGIAVETDDSYLRKQLLTTLIDLYSSIGKYDLAYNYQLKLTDLRDSLLTKDIMIDLANAEMKYQNAQNEKQILELQVENQKQSFMLKRSQYQMVIGFSLLALVVISLVLIYQRNRSRNEAKIHEFENKMFRLQIKPHFIFNVLSSIQGYMNVNDSKNASVYLSKFARLIRNVLEQSRKDFVTISKEAENLKYYAELQQLRYEDCFVFEIHIDEEIDPDIILIPPMLIQPIVENAIEHGIPRTSSDGLISVGFKKSGNQLEVEITDNGLGIDLDKSVTNEDSERESLSTKMIQEQLSYFSAQLKEDCSIEYSHAYPDENRKGTKVLLRIPYIQQKATDE